MRARDRIAVLAGIALLTTACGGGGGSGSGVAAPSQLPLTEAQLVAAGTRLLKVTQCMRAHGYPDWPDPIVNPNDVGFLPPRGVNISDPSPRLEAAGQACHLPSAP
jgi:hypothetical protein